MSRGYQVFIVLVLAIALLGAANSTNATQSPNATQTNTTQINVSEPEQNQTAPAAVQEPKRKQVDSSAAPEIPPGLADLPYADLVAKALDQPSKARAASVQQFSTGDFIIHLKTPSEVQDFADALSEMSSGEIRELAQTMREFAAYEKNPEHRFSTFNGFSASLTTQQFSELQESPLVASLEPNRKVYATLDVSVPLVNVTQVWSTKVDGQNLTGRGQSVCVIDTGVDYTHESLGNCTQAQMTNGTCDKVPAGYDFVNDDNDPFDDHSTSDPGVEGHGTHVAGIVAANGSVTGVAPGARIIAVKSLNSEGGGNFGNVTAGIEWCIDNSQTYNISSISMSLGTSCVDDGGNPTGLCYSSYCDANYTAISSAINNATGQGISVVVSTGNNGNYTRINSPACIQNATPVASSTDADAMSSFSNRNSLVQLTGPGSGIVSTCKGGGTCSKSGTSMATPHVSGAIAILTQYLNSTGQQKNPQEIETLLNSTGKEVDDPDTSLFYYRINVGTALNMLSLSPPITNASVPDGWQASPFNVTLNATDDVGVNYTSYRIDSGEWNNGTTILINTTGAHLIEFYSVDVNGTQEETKNATARLDMYLPSTNFSSTPNRWYSGSILLSLLAQDNHSGVNYTAYRYNGTWINSSTINITQEGDYVVEFFSVDNANNTENVSNVSIGLDSTLPAMNISSPIGWQNASFNITWNASDALSGFDYTRYRLDGGSWTNASNVTISSEGNHTVTISAFDIAGNENATNVSALLDLSAPNTSDDAPTSWQASSVTVTLTPTDALSGVLFTSYRLDGGSWTNTTQINVTSDGNHSVEYYSADNAGNIEAVLNTSVAIDTALPALAISAPSGWQTAAFNITWNASDALSGLDYTRYRVDNGSWTNASNATIGSDGNFTVTISAFDVAGNENTTNVTALLDTQSPNTSDDAPAGWSSSPVSVTLTSNDALSGINFTSYRLDGGNWTNYSQPINITSDANHSLEYFSTDVAGNQESTVTTSVAIDSVAPTLNVSAPDGWQNAPFNVTLNASDALSGVASTTIAVGNQSPQNTSNVTITQDGNHTVTLNASDAANNPASTNVTVLLDTQAPNTTDDAPTGWQTSNVTLTLNASDTLSGVKNTSYRVDAGNWTNATNLTIGDGNHTVEYYSTDFAGNQEPTRNVTVLVDTQAPVINSFTINTSDPGVNESVGFSANVTDASPSVTISVNGTNLNTTLSDGLWQATANFSSPATYQATVTATDVANNTVEQSLSFTVYQKQSLNNQTINDTTIDAKNTTRTKLRLKTNATVQANITILRSRTKPSSVNKSLPRAITHTTINLSQNAKDALQWANLTLTYEDDELGDTNESTLRLAFYNASADEWINLTDALGFVSATGRDTSANEVWANVTHFSTYGLTGDANQEPQEEDDSGSSGGSSGGGGGGGGGYAVAQSSNQSVVSLTFITAGTPVSKSISNDLLPVTGITLTPLADAFSTSLTFTREAIPADAPTGTVEYFEIDHPGLEASNVTITFEHQAGGDVALHRDQDGWQQLPTQALGDGTYEAQSPGLSRFAITDTQQEEPDEQETTEQEETDTQESAQTPTQQEESAPEQPAQNDSVNQTGTDEPGTGPLIPFYAFGALALLVLLALFAEKHWNKN